MHAILLVWSVAGTEITWSEVSTLLNAVY